MSVPAPDFTIVGVAHQPFAASPSLRFTLEVADPSGLEVYAIALSVQVNIDPARRTYDEPTRDSLVELFGEPERWPATTRSFVWSMVDVMVPSFTGEAIFELPLACTYDLEVQATHYFDALPDGEIPLSMHFSGRIMYLDETRRLQITQVPWSCSAQFGMPVKVWRDMIAHHFPHAGYVRLHHDTLTALAGEKARLGLPTFDAVVADLLGART